MVAHVRSYQIGAVQVIEHSRYMVETGSLEDEDCRSHVTFPIFQGQLTVLPEHVLGKCMCATKINETLEMIKGICSSQLPVYGEHTYRRVYRIVDVMRTGSIGPAKLEEHTLTLEPLFDLDDKYQPIPCRRN